MLLIPAVEAIVGGPVSRWPRGVLHYLFSTPTDTSPDALRTVAAFLYGNNVPCTLAVNFVKACAGMDDNNSWLYWVFDAYHNWAEAEPHFHSAMFWSMRMARYMWLNGPYGPHTDVISPPGGFDVVCGFGTTPRALRMNRRLSALRGTVHIF